jgi:hypothetical protein
MWHLAAACLVFLMARASQALAAPCVTAAADRLETAVRYLMVFIPMALALIIANSLWGAIADLIADVLRYSRFRRDMDD